MSLKLVLSGLKYLSRRAVIMWASAMDTGSKRGLCNKWNIQSQHSCWIPMISQWWWQCQTLVPYVYTIHALTVHFMKVTFLAFLQLIGTALLPPDDWVSDFIQWTDVVILAFCFRLAEAPLRNIWLIIHMQFWKFPEKLGILKERTKSKKDSIEMAHNSEECFTKVPISDSILRKYLQEDFSKVLLQIEPLL